MIADVAVDEPLQAELSRATGVAVSFRSKPVPITGGFWAQIYGFELDRPPEPFVGPLVLRVMPDAISGRREIVVQSWLGNAGYPVPPVLDSGSVDGLGEVFLVMPRVAGKSPLANLSLGSALFGLREILRSIPRRLADATTRLHVLDPASLRDRLGPTQVPLSCSPPDTE